MGNGILLRCFVVKALGWIFAVAHLDGNKIRGKAGSKPDKRRFAAALHTAVNSVIHEIKKYTAKI